VSALRVRGDDVLSLVRRAPVSPAEIQWHEQGSIELRQLIDVDAVVHLAGKSVATRWTARAKHEIYDSRVIGTRVLAEAVGESFRRSGKPDTFISASAIGYYGNRGNEILTEDSSSGGGFLAEVVRRWEDATEPTRKAGARVFMPRIGMVLAREGGALNKMLLPFRLGLGGKIGSGEQWISWIARTDLVRLILRALDDRLIEGVYNAVAPQPVRNRHFVKALGEALHRPAFFPLPTFAVKAMFGRMGVETILASTRVIPMKLQNIGYRFEYPELDIAMERTVG
jgi:uncharacterized protein (TIGR01777 family)